MKRQIPALTIRRAAMAAIIGAIGLIAAGCSSSSNADVTLPNGTHCRSESSGWFVFRSTSVACVDSTGKVIGSYSDR
jgi:hypothetical protein